MPLAVVAALVFAPFAAWYAYRAIRTVRTGVYEAWGQRVTRAEAPEAFWSGVARQVLWTVLIAATGCLAALGIRGPSIGWAVAGYVVLYVAIHVAVTLAVRRAHRDAGR